jgi:tetratricopeptide (TPR) repeat protein
MNRAVIAAFIALLAGLSSLLAQPKQPQPKTKGEAEALQAIGAAQDADSRIKACENVLIKFADTDFKPMLLMMIADAYRTKGDIEHEVIYAERVLKEGDPKSYQAMLMLAEAIAQRTREFDLDREEKLARADKFANDAIAAVKDAPKPRPDITDEQWEGYKKDLTAQAHQALGMSALVRKKYDVAVTEFKIAVESATQPDPATMVRLASAYNLTGKHDDAIAILDKVMAQSDVHPTIKQFAQAEKVRAIQAKGGAKPAAPQGETKKQ